jgi:preprotein translocase subunit SecY
MFEGLKSIFANTELKKRILFTLFVLIVCRLGSYLPVPGVNQEIALQAFKQTLGSTQNLFQLMDTFTGGSFAKLTVTALGVMPYISASIIMQLVMAINPALQREMKENSEAGKRKLSSWTRYLTVGLAFFQATLLSKYAISLNISSPGLIHPYIGDISLFGVPLFFIITMIVTMTTATLLLMWMGEQITERGIGNGTSLIITIGILSSLPSTFGNIFNQLNLASQAEGSISFTTVAILAVLFVIIVFSTIMVVQGQRNIPVQYARKSQDEMSNSAFIPLKINYAGVIPVIFASTLLMFPATIAQFLSSIPYLADLSVMLAPGSNVYMILFVGLIIFFTYFWTATQFNPDQIASDMKKSGAFIPGVRQGKPTQDYLEQTMGKITFLGSVFLAAIAVLPNVVGRILKVDASITYFFGGTSLLILIGVVLDTSKQIQSHMMMKKYDGFFRRSKSFF